MFSFITHTQNLFGNNQQPTQLNCTVDRATGSSFHIVQPCYQQRHQATPSGKALFVSPPSHSIFFFFSNLPKCQVPRWSIPSTSPHNACFWTVGASRMSFISSTPVIWCWFPPQSLCQPLLIHINRKEEAWPVCVCLTASHPWCGCTGWPAGHFLI